MANAMFDLIIPPALPPRRPRTFVPPEPTDEMLAERAEADAIIAAKKRASAVPLGIRFLRLLESRSVQHDMTTATIFHAVLKRRNSAPNRAFLGYQDISPRLHVTLR